MKSRGLVVVLALILATLATAGVFLYTRGVKQDAETGGALTTVIVSKVDIPANTDLNQLIDEDQFTTQQVPTDTVVQGAVTQISELKNQRNNTFILAGEQIPISRVEGSKAPGGVLSIPEGYQAVTVSLQGAPAVGAALSGGDNVTIYATFQDVKVVKLNPDFTPVVQPNAAGQSSNGFDTTVVLVPQSRVLRVQVATDGTASDGSGAGAIRDVAVTLSLTPEEAQKFIFGLTEGTVYLSLLPPNGEGQYGPPISIGSILNPPKPKKS